jgi:hypothetical protein
MVRFLGVCVALLGIASLVFGIVFVVMSCSAKAEIVDKIADEGFPMFGPSDNYPYLGVTVDAIANRDIIDTAADIDAAMDAIDGARHKMTEAPNGTALQGVDLFGALFTPTDFPGVGTLKLHEYSALLGFSGALGTAQMGLGMASLMQFVGIVSLIVGVALMLAGLVVFKLARPRETVSCAQK